MEVKNCIIDKVGLNAHIAQSVEHVLGKNGVISSNLIVGL